MKFKAIIAVALVLVLLVALTTPALAGKAAARGKLTPVNESDAAGRYVVYVEQPIPTQNIETIEVTVNAMKLDPLADYTVAFDVRSNGTHAKWVHDLAQSNSRGKLTFTVNDTGEPIGPNYSIIISVIKGTSMSGPVQLISDEIFLPAP